MRRWIIHWSIQDLQTEQPWPVCAGHREAKLQPLNAIKNAWEGTGTLVVTEVTDGICALGAFGNCSNDPVTTIPPLDISLLDPK